MALQQELRDIDVSTLDSTFQELSRAVHARYITGPPVELLAAFGKYPIIGALKDLVFTRTYIATRNETIGDVAATGSLMSVSALALYSGKHGAPRLEAVNLAKLPEAADAFDSRMIAAETPEAAAAQIDEMYSTYPFVGTLADGVLIDAMRTGSEREAATLANGTLRALGTLVTYAEIDAE